MESRSAAICAAAARGRGNERLAQRENFAEEARGCQNSLELVVLAQRLQAVADLAAARAAETDLGNFIMPNATERIQ